MIERALLNDAGVRGSGLITLKVTDVQVGPEDRSLAEELADLRYRSPAIATMPLRLLRLASSR